MERKQVIASFLSLIGSEFVKATVPASFRSKPISVSDRTSVPSVATPSTRKRVLRVAHLTDIHIVPHTRVNRHLDRLFEQLYFVDKPDFILNGGDCIMDALNRSKSNVRRQWNAWHNNLMSNIDIPMYSCIGNHDIWGWKSDSSKIKQDELYGKQWAMDELGMNKRYYSFDRNGWHFIVLDSSMIQNGNYVACLDEPQFQWLKEDLKNTPKTTPISIMSHIPIISFTPIFDGSNEKSGKWQVPGSWMHIDARRLKDLFFKYPNVKMCLSGHIHLHDYVEYLGVKYMCNGAVCGGWWLGKYQEFAPAYAIIDLYDDGTSTHQFKPYMEIDLPTEIKRKMQTEMVMV